MSKKTRIIILSVLAVLIVVVLSVSITTAFMKPIDQGGNITEVSLSSCAKIKLEGTTSIKLTNSYPMSRNKGLQTTPYTFTVTSYCDTYIGFNLYLATLSTNTLAASNIHYIITEKSSKEALVEGTLTSSLDDASNFTDTEKTELNTGLSGTYGNIFKLYNNKVPYKGSATYDLYLFVDENATEYQNTTFAAGVAVKSYEREKDVLLADYVKSQYTGTQGENSIYYHDANLTNGAGDNSYRYAGASESVNNFVCFGTNASPCPADNLYRIIGVFGDKVKLIKYEYVNSDLYLINNLDSNLLGTDGDYNAFTKAYSTYKGSFQVLDLFYWNNSTQKNTWSESNLNKVNLNTNFITNIGEKWANKIAETTWKVGGNTYANISPVIPSVAYQNEVVNPEPGSTSTTGETEYTSQIGLMYVSDYGYAAEPSAWTRKLSYDSGNGYSNAAVTSVNWMYMGMDEWTITRVSSDSDGVHLVSYNGNVNGGSVKAGRMVRPSFSLLSSITYKSGSGTQSDPILIS